MFGLNKHHPVAEHEADDDTERIYHEIRQVLRVSGVSLVFRSWAGFGRSFPLLWEAVRENAGTYAFEKAADQLRANAVRGALQLPAVHATADVPLGPSQLYQVGAALALYHYVDPKLLILTSAVRLALDEAGVVGSPSADARKLPRGVPPRMFPMEVVEEGSEDPLVRETFDDIPRHACYLDHQQRLPHARAVAGLPRCRVGAVEADRQECGVCGACGEPRAAVGSARPSLAVSRQAFASGSGDGRR